MLSSFSLMGLGTCDCLRKDTEQDVDLDALRKRRELPLFPSYNPIIEGLKLQPSFIFKPVGQVCASPVQAFFKKLMKASYK